MYGQSGWRHTPGMPKLDSFDAGYKPYRAPVDGDAMPKRKNVTRPTARVNKQTRSRDDSGYSSKHKKAVMNYG